MPQPFLRHVSRSLPKLTRPSAAPRLNGLPSSTLPKWTPICTRCYIKSHRRHFADDRRPNDSTHSLKTSTQATEPSNEHNASDSTPSIPNISGLPSAEEDRRSKVSKRFSHLMDNLQSNIFVASQRLNDLTGYSGIEDLKRSIVKMEKDLEIAQDEVRAARNSYKQIVADRAATQREVTSLLARKDTWTPSDLERFTTLYRSDHGNEQAVQEAATKLAESERIAEQTASKLSTSILSRYHEEQIWSDKIRQMSTWGTWGLMAVNILLFLVFQLMLEPWRRKRLTKGFEEKVKEALDTEKRVHDSSGDGTSAEEAGLDGMINAGMPELESVVNGENAPNEHPVVDAVASVVERDADESRVNWKKPETWGKGVQDLFSDKAVSLRKQDVTIIALEGAAVGAALAGILFKFLLRPN